MKTINKFTFKNLSDYLKHFRYLPTYRKGNKDAFYNPRNRQDLLIPIDKPEFTKLEVITLFSNSKATDMPPNIEWCRFQQYIYSIDINP